MPHPPFLTSRIALGAVCAGALFLVPVAADGATKATHTPAKLAITVVRSPPATLAAGGSFTVSGRVKNTGGRAAPALLGLTLRAKSRPKVVYTLGSGRLKSVRAGRTVAFKVKVTPATPKEAFPTGFLLQACVKTARGGATTCRKAPGRIVLQPVAKPTPPVTTPTPPVTTPTTPADPTVYGSGARTLNDTLFPNIGNGGYDALHYDLDLNYTNILTRVLRGTATMTAKATQNLKDFSLDFQGMAVSAVTVNGVPASYGYDFDASKLIVTPPAGIRDGTEFEVAVTYGGPPSPVIDPDGSPEGWLTSITYGATSLGEPMGSQGWFPSNNVPFDKATYDISVTTPSTFKAVSNGTLENTVDNGDGTTRFDWHEGSPMASYLATVSVNRFDTSASVFTNPDRPLYVYLEQSINSTTSINDVTRKAQMIAQQQRVPGILDWYASYYGVPYPFKAAGGIVPRVDTGIGYVLETQTKPTYPTSSASTAGSSLATIAHENGHQWFGDLVTLTQWKDIWLNEGLTEFSSWLWQERASGIVPAPATTTVRFDTQYATTSTAFWNIAPADPPSAADIFDSNAMYTRGAMVAEGTREILGETRFVQVMHEWLTQSSYANGTTEEWIALVKASDPTRADRWTEYYEQWLYTAYTGSPALGNKPQMNPSNFDAYVLPAVP